MKEEIDNLEKLKKTNRYVYKCKSQFCYRNLYTNSFCKDCLALTRQDAKVPCDKCDEFLKFDIESILLGKKPVSECTNQ